MRRLPALVPIGADVRVGQVEQHEHRVVVVVLESSCGVKHPGLFGALQHRQDATARRLPKVDAFRPAGAHRQHVGERTQRGVAPHLHLHAVGPGSLADRLHPGADRFVRPMVVEGAAHVADPIDVHVVGEVVGQADDLGIGRRRLGHRAGGIQRQVGVVPLLGSAVRAGIFTLHADLGMQRLVDQVAEGLVEVGVGGAVAHPRGPQHLDRWRIKDRRQIAAQFMDMQQFAGAGWLFKKRADVGGLRAPGEQ